MYDKNKSVDATNDERDIIFYNSTTFFRPAFKHERLKEYIITQEKYRNLVFYVRKVRRQRM